MNDTVKQKKHLFLKIQLAVTVYVLFIWMIMSVLVFVIAGCSNNSKNIPIEKQRAIDCANNWQKQGYDFDPNTMTCYQMYERALAIRTAKHWNEKGYVFDFDSMTMSQINQKVKDIDRARYWQDEGYEFDPNLMTAQEMDKKVNELDTIKYWEKEGYYYDPNSQTVFLSAHKRTKLKSLAGLHGGGGGRQVFGSSYRGAASQRQLQIASVDRGSAYNSTGASGWQVFETTAIDGRVRRIRKGTIFKTKSKNIYEVFDVVILLELEVRPDVTVLTNGQFHKLFIEGVEEPLLCRKLNCGGVIEATIINEFDGFEYGNIYKLSNGQIWEQTEFHINICIYLRPEVTIWYNGVDFQLKVNDEDEPVTVQQL